MKLLTLLSVIIFFIGMYFYVKYTDTGLEGFSISNPRCPTMLIQKGSKYYLYNPDIAKVPGVNPVEFNNLEEYTEFLKWQRGQGITCPVLYLQKTYDAQGTEVYKARPSVTEPQGGLPMTSENKTLLGGPLYKPPNPTLLVDATQSDQPYNKGGYPAFDQTSYYVGTTTPLDYMNAQQQSLPVSPNPMDTNWGGADFTQSLVDKGYYASNEVNIRIQ